MWIPATIAMSEANGVAIASNVLTGLLCRIAVRTRVPVPESQTGQATAMEVDKTTPDTALN